MTDPRVTKTRAALAQAVLALASEKPFTDVTITEIAVRAGVGYASFFRHYKDQDALLAVVAGGRGGDEGRPPERRARHRRHGPPAGPRGRVHPFRTPYCPFGRSGPRAACLV